MPLLDHYPVLEVRFGPEPPQFVNIIGGQNEIKRGSRHFFSDTQNNIMFGKVSSVSWKPDRSPLVNAQLIWTTYTVNGARQIVELLRDLLAEPETAHPYPGFMYPRQMQHNYDPAENRDTRVLEAHAQAAEAATLLLPDMNVIPDRADLTENLVAILNRDPPGVGEDQPLPGLIGPFPTRRREREVIPVQHPRPRQRRGVVEHTNEDQEEDPDGTPGIEVGDLAVQEEAFFANMNPGTPWDTYSQEEIQDLRKCRLLFWIRQFHLGTLPKRYKQEYVLFIYDLKSLYRLARSQVMAHHARIILAGLNDQEPLRIRPILEWLGHTVDPLVPDLTFPNFGELIPEAAAG